MKILGQEVLHKMFGKGKITQVDGNKFTVVFTRNSMEKVFLYPGAFEKFLKFTNAAYQEEADAAVAKMLARQEEEYKQKHLEYKQQERERRKEQLELFKKKKKALEAKTEREDRMRKELLRKRQELTEKQESLVGESL